MLRAANGFASGGPAALDGARPYAPARCRPRVPRSSSSGSSTADGLPDLAAVAALTDAVPGCPWTFHRAVDHAADRDLLRERLADATGLDTFLTAGSARGVDDGMDVLRAEAARTAAGEPGYGQQLMVGGGLRLEHVEPLREAGVDAFHIGGAARLAGWTTPVSPGLVRTWRTTLDAEPVLTASAPLSGLPSPGGHVQPAAPYTAKPRT